MKVKESLFLKEKKPLLKKLLDELLAGYEYASILASDSIGKIYNVSKTGTNIREDANLTERGFCVKICDKGKTAEYSFNEISEEAIPGILENIKKNLIALDGAIPAGIEAYRIDKLDDERICIDESTEYEEDPEELGNEKIIELLTRISEKGRAYDERIINCSASFSYQKYTKMFLSRNKDMTQNVMWSAAWLAVLGSAGEEIKDSYQPMSILGGSEILKNLEARLETACRTTIELFDAQPIEPGEYECICMPDVTGMIVHEAFGHGVEMDMFVKKRALGAEYIGKRVGSDMVTMHEGAKCVRDVTSYAFDDEGTPAGDVIEIDKGILKTGVCDALAALRLGTKPTGNGKRENFEHKVYTRMTNTMFDPGPSTKEEMIASVKKGYLLEGMDSGMEDPKHWGIQCIVSRGYEIIDGKLTGKVISPVIMTGYVPDLLGSISMASTDYESYGNGACGKGHKEWVKTVDGGPYLKAVAKLG